MSKTYNNELSLCGEMRKSKWGHVHIEAHIPTQTKISPLAEKKMKGYCLYNE